MSDTDPRTSWAPAVGAWPVADGFEFRVWAHGHSQVELVIRTGGGERRVLLEPSADGTYRTTVDGLTAGTRYGYALDGTGPFPDPASRAQPDGVHELSALVDPGRFTWSDVHWRGVPLDRAVFYELHVGAFTPAGTFAGVVERLAYLADLGVTVIELMPVADFPGDRNWGYDGVSLFAPARCYGSPDDLRRLVDAAHGHGLAVVLDVVYNHFGPDGAYGFAYSPHYASPRHESPWGAGLNFEDEHAQHVRLFVVENAQHWLHEYHIDGLRLDATHAIKGESEPHIIAELTSAARASLPDRSLLFVAEDDRNLPVILRATEEGGWGCDAVWADDFHHQARRMVTGDREAYFQDFSDEARDLALTIRRGWLYVGQPSVFRGVGRGESPDGLSPSRMVICLQNHDQVGNRARGDRLHHHIDFAVFRALTAVLLCAPETPLLFMGEEWAADTPFQFFTDHAVELGRLVTAGRRNEFAAFEAFRDAGVRASIPDPQAIETFRASRLVWEEQHDALHAATLALHRRLLGLRRAERALSTPGDLLVEAPDRETLVMVRGTGRETVLLAARFSGAGSVDLRPWVASSSNDWSVLLTTEDAAFLSTPAAGDLTRPVVSVGANGATVEFRGPAAVLLRMS